MMTKIIFSSTLLMALAWSAQAQQCTDEQMKKVLNEMPTTNNEDALNQKKFEERVETLAKLKRWSSSQKTNYAMKALLSEENHAKGQDPLSVSNKMMDAIAKKDCKTLEQMNKTSAEAGKQMWSTIFKKVDADIAKAK